MDPALVWTFVCCQVVFLAVLVAFCRPRPMADSKPGPTSYTWDNFMADVEAGIPIDIIHEKCLRFGVPRRPKAPVAGIYFPEQIHLPDGSIPWLSNVEITPSTATLEISNIGTGVTYSNSNSSVYNVPAKLTFRSMFIGGGPIQRYQ